MEPPTHPPGAHPDTDELLARLCADYLDHLNGAPGHPRSELTSLALTPKAARRLREALDLIDEFHRLATRPAECTMVARGAAQQTPGTVPPPLPRPAGRTTVARGAAQQAPGTQPPTLLPPGGRTNAAPPSIVESSCYCCYNLTDNTTSICPECGTALGNLVENA